MDRRELTHFLVDPHVVFWAMNYAQLSPHLGRHKVWGAKVIPPYTYLHYPLPSITLSKFNLTKLHHNLHSPRMSLFLTGKNVVCRQALLNPLITNTVR
jgi:hypothetical protein